MIALVDPKMSEYKAYRAVALDLAYQRGTQVYIFTQELFRLAKITYFNAPGMFAQAWHETAGFTSKVWTKQKNPAGIKRADRDTYQTYVNGVDAARAFVVHFSAYVPSHNPEYLKRYLYLDERYGYALRANSGRTYKTFQDLTGRWASDPEYGKLIEKVYHELYG